MDKRTEKLAENIVKYSCRSFFKAEKNVMISCVGHNALPFVKAVIKEIYKARAKPFVEIKDSSVERELLMGSQ